MFLLGNRFPACAHGLVLRKKLLSFFCVVESYHICSNADMSSVSRNETMNDESEFKGGEHEFECGVFLPGWMYLFMVFARSILLCFFYWSIQA